ncbi:MAG: DUF1559 domain-containing protein [Planctomycetaceae bacterium]
MVSHIPREFPIRASSTVRRGPARAGISLVEMIVVVAILMAFVALILPAVQAARESARRVACAAKLRGLATALLVFECTNRTLPAATVVSTGTSTAACTDCWNPWAEARVAAGFTPGSRQGTSWIREVLPQLDLLPMYSQWNPATNVLGNAAIAGRDIPGLLCPSRRGGLRTGSGDELNLPDPTWTGGGTDYGGCLGRSDGFENAVANDHRFAHQGDATTAAKIRGAFRANAGTSLTDFIDGCSTTILVGEVQRLRPLPGGTNPADVDWRTSQDGWAVGGAATLFSTGGDPVLATRDGINNGFFESPGSDHAGGAFFATADGAVRFMIDGAAGPGGVFPLLGSIADGATADPDAFD